MSAEKKPLDPEAMQQLQAVSKEIIDLVRSKDLEPYAIFVLLAAVLESFIVALCVATGDHKVGEEMWDELTSRKEVPMVIAKMKNHTDLTEGLKDLGIT